MKSINNATISSCTSTRSRNIFLPIDLEGNFEVQVVRTLYELYSSSIVLKDCRPSVVFHANEEDVIIVIILKDPMYHFLQIVVFLKAGV